MNLNELLVINAKTKLDDLSIMINELDVLILLYRKIYSLKNLDIRNVQYKNELLDFIQIDDRRINIDEFVMKNNKVSLVTYNANRMFFQNGALEHRLFNVLFSSNANYWNQEKRNLAKEKIEIINARLFSLNRLRLALFFT